MIRLDPTIYIIPGLIQQSGGEMHFYDVRCIFYLFKKFFKNWLYIYISENDYIAVAHDMKNLDNNINSTLIFRGHSHKSKTRDNHIIYVPALTDNYQGAYEFMPVPGFLDVEFFFFDSKITRVNLTQLAFFNEQIRLANEVVMTIRPDYQERYEKKLAKQKK